MSPRAPDRLLRVDLSAERVRSEPVPDGWRRRYVGGKGLGARYLYDELEPGTDPLGPENVLLFMLGPVSGYLPGEGRYAAITRSPLTGAFLDSYAGGEFPTTLAGALGDHVGVLVSGSASEPVHLVVEDGDARIERTPSWGADAVDTAREFPEAAVACIGPAGEQQVLYSTIASDEATHHAGRGGAGAVMGSKRLKAIVARGEPPTPDDALLALRERATKRYGESETGRWQTTSETLETVDFADATDVLAARGWQERGFEGADDVGIEPAREAATGRERDDEIPGGFRIETEDGETVPRGATGMSLGAGLGIDDFEAVVELGDRCNRLGLDLIDAGNAVAWAIRATDAGLLERDLSFGNPADARRLLGEIATRETDLGDALADGVDAAGRRYGGEAFVPSVKRMSLPSYDPRGTTSMALAYATSDRGGCHRRARPIEREAFDGPWSPERAARAVLAAQNRRSLQWSLVADDFVGESLEVSAWLEAVDAPYADLEAAGARIWTLVRLFNVREGFDRTDDELPPAIEADAAFDDRRFEAALETYYAIRGWDERGRPTPETVARLGLEDVGEGARVRNDR